jgi:glucose/arabinose dehydrogenase
MQAFPDGSNRLCVLEQPGIIKVFPNAAATSPNEVATFLDIRNKVVYSAGQEIGLLGLAFHPQFNTNRHVYIYYIDQPSNYRINIVRYTVTASNPNILDPASEFVIAQYIKNQGDSNHNGGKIAFGPDGYLYVSIGDGGGGGDPQKNGQNLETVFGSMLRIDVDLNGDNPLENNAELPNGNYEIPSDNPRVGQAGLDELYAWGIRNTWKFSFDTQGRLWGADVGQNIYEEINLIEKGGNYGWNRFEANSQPSYGSGTSLVTSPDIKPIFFYDHSAGDVSITGGYQYRGSLIDARLQNSYIYGDYVSGRVWALRYNAVSKTATNELLFKTNGEFISSFGEDANGELYFLGYSGAAKIYKLTETNTGPTTTPLNGIGSWEALGEGTNGAVETLAQDENGTIYVGGVFSSAGGVSVSNLAQIDPSGTWSAFTQGANGPIYSLAISNNGILYAGGDFSEIGGISANNIAYHDGTTWNAMGSGTNGPITKIALDNSENALYVGGVFTTAGSLNVNYIAKWENSTWQELSDTNTGISGTNNEIRSIAFDENNVVYVGGNFDTAGGINANRIASWDGNTWKGLGAGTSGFVQAIIPHEDYIYVGGNFVSAGNSNVNRIARYKRTTNIWEPLGNGLSGNVNALAIKADHVYVTGTFETASDVANVNKIVNNVARWNPVTGWEALGEGTNVGIDTRGNALLFTNNSGALLLGGNFNRSGATTGTNNIAKWTLSPTPDDLDGDGVPNEQDACPNTPQGALVDVEGCPLATFPFDQFLVSTRQTSCIGTPTGTLTVTAKTVGNYLAQLTTEGREESINFTDSFTLSDLTSGNYELCVRLANQEAPNTCSKITVAEPNPINVFTSMDFLNNTVTLTMEGSSAYTINLNGKIIESKQPEMTLSLDKNVNALTVSSKEACQGSYTETIVLEDAVIAAPNPFKEYLRLELGTTNREPVEVFMYDAKGQLIYTKNYSNTEEFITIVTDGLANGLYFVRIKIGSVNKFIKAVKS